MIKGEIVQVSKEINPVKQGKAEDVHKEILVRTIVTANNLLELGRLFKEVRDEKLYKLLGADSFKEYCAYPEIPYARTTIYSFIGIYEKYILKLEIPHDTVARVGHWKLQLLKAKDAHGRELVKDKHDVSVWFSRALNLSDSDLINEVRSAQGKPEMLPVPFEEEDEEKYYKFNKTGWIEFVRNSPCIIHRERSDTESAHFPRTKKRGGEIWEIIPLCHECHDQAHRDTYNFLWLNRVKIFKWFYKLLIGGK